jgi:serine/threonine-protein kinase HipA
MLRVWADRRPVGILERRPRSLNQGLGDYGTTFTYDRGLDPEQAVSLTMPVRNAPWGVGRGLLPIFDMNLPEGALKDYLTRTFAKAAGSFDDLDLLSVVGRSQIGRLRFTAMDADLDEEVPFASIDEIMTARRDGGLYEYLIEKFATYSGLAGVQPKVMLRATEGGAQGEEREKTTVRGATHIVKFWENTDYAELAANEFFCLEIARRVGLDVPRAVLSDDGAALVVERFDLRPDGSYRGYEDFCVLNGLTAEHKYNGGYETRLFKRVSDFVSIGADNRRAALRDCFRLFVVNCAIQNGDAHLKNYGVVYDDVTGVTALAPVYDLITTRAYLAKDKMALSLGGSTRWPTRKNLALLGQARCGLAGKDVHEIMEQTADAVADVAASARVYFDGHRTRQEIGDRMLAAWADGVRDSLGFESKSVAIRPVVEEEVEAPPAP